MPARIGIDRGKIADFCRNHPIRKLSLFGSVLRDDFGPHSDIDVLVEFDPAAPLSLLDVVGIELELSDLLGRKVDVREPEERSRYFRQRVLDTAEVLYVHG